MELSTNPVGVNDRTAQLLTTARERGAYSSLRATQAYTGFHKLFATRRSAHSPANNSILRKIDLLWHHALLGTRAGDEMDVHVEPTVEELRTVFAGKPGALAQLQILNEATRRSTHAHIHDKVSAGAYSLLLHDDDASAAQPAGWVMVAIGDAVFTRNSIAMENTAVATDDRPHNRYYFLNNYAVFTSAKQRFSSPAGFDSFVKAITDCGCDTHGDCPADCFLNLACKEGNFGEAALLLTLGVSPNIESIGENDFIWDSSGPSSYTSYPLLHAVGGTSRGHLAILQLILAHDNVDVNHSPDHDDTQSTTALNLACWLGNVEAVRILLLHQAINVNLQDSKGRTPLATALRAAFPRPTHMYRTYGTYVPDPPMPAPPTPESGKAVSVVMLLVNHPMIDLDGNALEKMITDERFETCKKKNCSQLHIGRHYVHAALACMLSFTNFQPSSALHIACTANNLPIVKHLLHNISPVESTAKYLRACLPVNTSDHDKNGDTPLHIACRAGHSGIVDQLLLLTKDENIAQYSSPIAIDKACDDAVGNTPLMTACLIGHQREHIIVELLKAGCDIDLTNDLGDTALHMLSREGEPRIPKMLLMFGADLEATDADGCSAAELALESNHETLCDMFIALQHLGISDSPLSLAAVFRMPRLLKSALASGRMDPEMIYDEPSTYIEDVRKAIAMASRTPAQLDEIGLSGMPNPCQETVRLLTLATSRWRPTSHWLYHSKVRSAVRAVIHASHRLLCAAASIDAMESAANSFRCAAFAEGCDESVRRQLLAAADRVQPLPLLPQEVWLHILGYLNRDDWPLSGYGWD